VWVTTAATHSVRRVDPASRDVTTIKLDSIADPTHIEAGLGALWVDCWTDAFARIDATTGESTPIYMPTSSDVGFGFTIGEGRAWALDRQHGIIYALDRRTGEVDGDGINLGGPAVDAVGAGGTVYILMKSKVLAELDESSRVVYDSVRLPARPVGIERDGSTFIVGFSGNRFATYQAGTLTHTKLFSMFQPWNYGEASRGEFWVTVPSAGALYRFDARTGDRLGDPIDFTSSPVAVNFEPSGRAWVGLESGELLTLDVPRA
jgi:streptogramin lyase